MKLRTTLCVFASISLFATSTFITAAKFDDVPKEHPHYKAIRHLENTNSISKKANFNPEESISRAALLKMTLSYAGFEPEEGKDYSTPFEDVPSNSWFAPYVNKALELEIIHFNGDNPYFHPHKSITRVQGLKLIFKTLGIPNPKFFPYDELEYEDVIPESAHAHVAYTAQELRLFDDREYFLPKKRLSRAESAEVIYRLRPFAHTSPEETKEGIPQVSISIGDTGSTSETSSLTSNPKFKVLEHVWDRIHQKYVFKDEIDDEALINGAIHGIVKNLEDPYSQYQEPEEAESYTNTLDGEFEGIGATVEILNDYFTIISPLKDSPAEKAGLKPQDIVLKVDGVELKGKSIQESIKLIKGPKGSTVILTVKRGSVIKDYPVIRDVIVLQSVEYEMERYNIGYMRINSFTPQTNIQFKEAMDEFTKKEAKGIIIDLRNNPGGYLNVATVMLSYFVEDGAPVASIRFSKERMRVFKARGGGEYKDNKIVILTNQGTASASEIIAGTMQDYGLAKVVGETSFGKGTVQEIQNYKDGSLLKLSIAEWLTASGRNINKVGLEPDIVVEVTEENSHLDDPQRDRAIKEILNWTPLERKTAEDFMLDIKKVTDENEETEEETVTPEEETSKDE